MPASDVPVVILCGGEGTRLRAVTGGSQKVLIDVAEEPFLGLLTRYLAGQGLCRFVYAAGFQGEAVAEFGRALAASLGVAIDVAIESRPLGTGGAIRFAAGRFDDPLFFVVNGDSLCEFSYEAMASFHREHAARFSMALVAATPTSDGGFVRIDGDRLVGFAEKDYHADHSFLNAGTYLMDRDLVARIPAGRAVSLERELLPAWTADALYGFRTGSVLHDIGTPDRLAAFRARSRASAGR